MKEKEELVSCGTLARLFGLTERRVQQLAKDGLIPKAQRGEYPFLPSVKAYIQFLQEAASRAGGESQDIIRHRTRYEAARAEQREIDLAVKKGELVLMDDVREEVSGMVMNFRARILSLPTTIAAQGTGMTRRAELENLAKKLIHEALNELSRYHTEPPERAKTPARSGGKRKTSARNKRQPVG